MMPRSVAQRRCRLAIDLRLHHCHRSVLFRMHVALPSPPLHHWSLLHYLRTRQCLWFRKVHLGYICESTPKCFQNAHLQGTWAYISRCWAKCTLFFLWMYIYNNIWGTFINVDQNVHLKCTFTANIWNVHLWCTFWIHFEVHFIKYIFQLHFEKHLGYI